MVRARAKARSLRRGGVCASVTAVRDRVGVRAAVNDDIEADAVDFWSQQKSHRARTF